jgi:hypothetical protein
MDVRTGDEGEKRRNTKICVELVVILFSLQIFLSSLGCAVCKFKYNDTVEKGKL